VVAQQVHTSALILERGFWAGCWSGRSLDMAELAATLPEVGGQYAYLREAYHPGRRISVWMGAVVRHPDRRHGSCIDHLRPVLS